MEGNYINSHHLENEKGRLSRGCGEGVVSRTVFGYGPNGARHRVWLLVTHRWVQFEVLDISSIELWTFVYMFHMAVTSAETKLISIVMGPHCVGGIIHIDRVSSLSMSL